MTKRIDKIKQKVEAEGEVFVSDSAVCITSLRKQFAET